MAKFLTNDEKVFGALCLLFFANFLGVCLLIGLAINFTTGWPEADTLHFRLLFVAQTGFALVYALVKCWTLYPSIKRSFEQF